MSIRLGVLFMTMCFVPRLLRCLFADSVCPDAFFYFDRASAFEQGSLSHAFAGGMNLNLYPLILAGLHQCGLDWIDAGRGWNLVVMSLTVLPLFGWVRRVTDDRTAALACIMYAVWPVMTEIASEPIRDPSYWLLMNLLCYLGITTAERPTVGRGLLTAIVWAMAVLTRMEAWLLLLPLSWWIIDRVVQSPLARRRLLLAGTTCVAAVVGLAALVNLTVGRQAGTWITGRLEMSLPGVPWLHQLLHGSGSLRPDGRVVGFVDPTTLRSFTQNFTEGLDPLNLAALILGLYCGRHLVRDRTLKPLLVWAAIMLVAIWCRTPDQRYFCQVYFVLMPFMAIGGRAFIDFVGDRLSDWRERDLRRRWTVAWLCLFSIVSTFDAVATWGGKFENNYRVAEWFRTRFPSDDAYVLSDGYCVPARFFMTGPRPSRPYFSTGTLEPALKHGVPDVVVYSCRAYSSAAIETMCGQLARSGYRHVEPAETGTDENYFSVWVRLRADDAPARPQLAESPDDQASFD